MSGFLIVNPHSGNGGAPEELVREAEARGIRVHVLADGDDVPELARRAEATISPGMSGSIVTTRSARSTHSSTARSS
jgi:hypothetical protein